MDVTREYHTKSSKSERERQIAYNITSIWNLKTDTNEPLYETKTHSGHREQIGCQMEGFEGGIEWEV